MVNDLLLIWQYFPTELLRWSHITAKEKGNLVAHGRKVAQERSSAVFRRAAKITKNKYEYSCEDFHAVKIHMENTDISNFIGISYSGGCRGRRRPYPVLCEVRFNREFTFSPLLRPMYVGVDENAPSSTVAKWSSSGMSNLGISEDEWEFQGWAVFFS
jgi:hypothetical protein